MPQGKRGKALESMIMRTNETYKQKGIALVDKVPTPWNVQFNKRTGRVYRAFPEKKGTVDFVGISHGRSIAFDAKSTNSRTSFPLSNIEEHQKNYLLQHQDQGGISFIVVEFAKLREWYFLPIDDLAEWWNQMEAGGRKSIPYKWFELNCNQIKSEKGILLHYLKYCNSDYKKKGRA